MDEEMTGLFRCRNCGAVFEEKVDVARSVSLRPTAKWVVMRRMADGAECKCGNCGRHETFTSFDRHTDHVYCCRCGYKMEGFYKEITK